MSTLGSRVALDEQSRLVREITCLRCGYNLRGAEVEGACPECGLEVERSLRGDRLMFADPTWLENVCFGWVALGWVLSVGTGVVFAVSFVPLAMKQLWVMLTTVGVWVAAIGFCGWFATQRDPEERGLERKPAVSRPLMRWSLLAYAAIAMLMLASSALGEQLPALWGLGALAAWVMGLCGVFAGLAYARHLARRIPAPNMARQTKILTWGFALSFAGVIVVMGAMFIVGTTFVSTGTGPASQQALAPGQALFTGAMLVTTISSCVAQLGLITFTIWGVVLTFVLGYRLRRIAREARTSAG